MISTPAVMRTPSATPDTAIGEAIAALRVNAIRYGNKGLEEIADRAHAELMAIRTGKPAKVSEDVERDEQTLKDQIDKASGCENCYSTSVESYDALNRLVSRLKDGR